MTLHPVPLQSVDGKPITRQEPPRGALIMDHYVISSAGSRPVQKPYFTRAFVLIFNPRFTRSNVEVSHF